MALVVALALPPSAAADPAPLGQVGSSGSEAGKLQNPQDVAVDGSGNLYVSEQQDRISVFKGSTGAFTSAFGWGVDTGADAFEFCTTGSG